MKAQLIAALKLKNSALPEKVVKLLAEKLLPKVTDEESIATVIENFDNSFGISEFAAVIKTEGDTRYNEALFKANTGKPQSTPPVVQTTEPGEENPMQQMLNMMKGMSEKINTLETAKVQGDLKGQLLNRLTELKIPHALAKNATMTDASSVESTVTEIQAQHAEYQKVYGGGGPNRPTSGLTGAPTNQTNDQVVAEMKAFNLAKSTNGNMMPVLKEIKG